jgi:hypothetical protein
VNRLGPYSRVLRQPTLRRVLPAALVSSLGDGMSLVAVAWLAILLAPPAQRGVWTGLAVAAYALPATVGTAILGPLVRRLDGARLVALDASLRAVALGAVAGLAAAGVLSPGGYVALLALSSLLHAWGGAGMYTLVAEVLPDEDRVTANALLSTFAQAAVVVGPALAGLFTALAGAAWVIGLDAASFAVLAAVSWLVRASAAPVDAQPAHASGGLRTLARHPQLLGLVAVTCLFYFLYGPVEVALPVHVAVGLHGSAGLLGAFWAVLGVGAVAGGLCAGLLQRFPLWTVVVAIIVGWGLALLPVGLSDALVPAMAGFAVGGVFYGPFVAICTALFQRTSPPQVLSRVLATKNALIIPSAALGSLLGGPVVGVIGGRYTLLASALGTIALGLAVVAVPAIRAPGAAAGRP